MLKCIVVYSCALVLSASAIVVQTNATAEIPPADLDWSFVYNYQGSSAVAVDAYWMLTAGHVADDGDPVTMEIDGTIYTQQGLPVYHGDGIDLALIRFDKPLPGYYPLYTDSFTTLPGLEVIMVGFGHTGTVSSNYWTVGTAGRGDKRWGSQVIDSTAIHEYNFGGELGENRGFWMQFNMGNTTNEAGAAAGDSGGGVFYNDNGEWKLTGIMTATRGAPDETFAITMSEYSDWIENTIPEPAVTGMMGITLLGLYFTRSIQRRKKHIREKFFPGRTYACDSYMIPEADEAIVFAVFDETPDRNSCSGIAASFEAWVRELSDAMRALGWALWNQLIDYKEHMTEKAGVSCDRIKKRVATGVDRLLDSVSRAGPDRAVAALNEKKAIIFDQCRKRATGGLDAFLIKLSWDRQVMRCRRFRQSIRRLFRPS